MIIPQPATLPAVPPGPYASSLTVTTRLPATPAAVAHSPVPIAMRWPFSVNATSAASGSGPGSPGRQRGVVLAEQILQPAASCCYHRCSSAAHRYPYGNQAMIASMCLISPPRT